MAFFGEGAGYSGYVVFTDLRSALSLSVLLVNNAGIMATPPSMAADGLEFDFIQTTLATSPLLTHSARFYQSFKGMRCLPHSFHLLSISRRLTLPGLSILFASSKSPLSGTASLYRICALSFSHL